MNMPKKSLARMVHIRCTRRRGFECMCKPNVQHSNSLTKQISSTDCLSLFLDIPAERKLYRPTLWIRTQRKQIDRPNPILPRETPAADLSNNLKGPTPSQFGSLIHLKEKTSSCSGISGPMLISTVNCLKSIFRRTLLIQGNLPGVLLEQWR